MSLAATRSAVAVTFLHSSKQLDLEPRYLPLFSSTEDERENPAQR